jgi:glycosyltransferase involved in cell wall biosynthesis
MCISRRLCNDPETYFVIRNAPPLMFAQRREKRTSSGSIRLVYSGSTTGLGAEGIQHLLHAMALSRRTCTLTIFPAEGRSKAERIAEIIGEHGMQDCVRLEDRVERDRLAGVLARFDVGVVLYPVRPGQDNNSLMAAPNKLYEYLAAGLAILASDNETMKFVGEEGLGWNIHGVSPEKTAEFLNGLQCSNVEACCERAAFAFREQYNYESQAELALRWFARQIESSN